MIRIKSIDLSGYKSKRNPALKSARLKLKQQLAKDTNKYVPLGVGTLRNSVLRSAGQDDEYLAWTTPYAHFQWYGKVMVGVRSHSPWAGRGEKKVYTGRDLTYRAGGKDWWTKAKSANLATWIKLAKQFYGGMWR